MIRFVTSMSGMMTIVTRRKNSIATKWQLARSAEKLESPHPELTVTLLPILAISQYPKSVTGEGVSINYGRVGTDKSVGGSLNSSTLLWGGSPNSRHPLWGDHKIKFQGIWKLACRTPRHTNSQTFWNPRQIFWLILPSTWAEDCGRFWSPRRVFWSGSIDLNRPW